MQGRVLAGEGQKWAMEWLNGRLWFVGGSKGRKLRWLGAVCGWNQIDVLECAGVNWSEGGETDKERLAGSPGV